MLRRQIAQPTHSDLIRANGDEDVDGSRAAYKPVATAGGERSRMGVEQIARFTAQHVGWRWWRVRARDVRLNW